MPEIFAAVTERKEPDQKPEDSSQETHLPPKVLNEAALEAERILDSYDPLAEADRHLAALICGERKNRQKLFLKCVATKSKDKRLLWIVLITGTEGSGKSTMQKIFEKSCRCKVVGRLTKHALDYMNLVNFDVLVLKEFGHTDKEEDGLSTIKFVSLDDDGYTVEVPWRDPDSGIWTTKTYKIPPIDVLSSSTRVQFDPQFERRAEFFNPDESEEQTVAVRRFKAERERHAIQVKLGTRRYTNSDFALAVLSSLLAKIEDLDVEIPFPRQLDHAILSKAMRSRGDIDKLMMNVRAYHLLLQRSQFKIQRGEKKVIFASPAGAARVIELFRESFDAMLGGVDKRTAVVVQQMVKIWLQEGHVCFHERTK